MPMQVHAYEDPIKSGARRVVRQLFFFWFIGSALTVLIWHKDISRSTDDAAIIWAFVIASGAIAAVPLWLFYRFIRFAIG